MFGEERYFSADDGCSEDYDGIVFELGSGEGLRVPYSQLEANDIGSSVRGMQLVGSGMSPVLAMDSEFDHHPEFHVIDSKSTTSRLQQQKPQIVASLPSYKHVTCKPRLVPAIPLNQSFDVNESVETVVNKMESLLAQFPGLEMSFLASEFVWSCQQTCGVASIAFEVRLYRYAHKHEKSGSLMVEMQRNFGDRMQYFAIYDSVRSELLNNSEGADAGFEFETLPVMSEDNSADNAVSENDIKLTLLSIIANFATAEYKTLIDAVHLVGTIFAPMYGLPQFSAVDLQLLFALEVLSLNHPQFYCLQSFVMEKKSLASQLHYLNASATSSTYQSAVLVR
jgi:hypothetical protein